MPRCKILQNLGVSKTYKMRVFGSHNLQPILALFNWRGPKLVNETKVEHHDYLTIRTIGFRS